MDTPSVNLVALRDARERAVALLTQRFSEDVIDHHALEQRLDKLHAATTLEELAAVTADLQDPHAPATALVPSAAALPSAPQHAVLAVFSAVQRGGAWTPATQEHVLAVMGAAELDFREAHLAPGTTELRVTAVMGSVTVVVPPGMPVELNILPLMGSAEMDQGSAPSPASASGLRITGLALMGAVEVLHRQPGEDVWARHGLHHVERSQRRLQRAERKLEKARVRAGLPPRTERPS